MRTFTVAILLGTIFMTGCSHDADSKRQPGQSFFRPGGDVVVGGNNGH